MGAFPATDESRTIGPVRGIQAFIDSCFEPLFRLYVFTLLLLPSGSLFGVNVKAILFLVLLAPAIERYLTLMSANVGWLLAVPGIFLVWVLIGLLKSFETEWVLGEYKDMITAISGSFIVAIFVQTARSGTLSFIRLVIFGELAAALAKVLIITYAVIFRIPVDTIINSISAIFGVQLAALSLGDLMGRIEFVSDHIIPLCLYAVVCSGRELRFSRTAVVFLVAALLISDALSFSRYLWAFAAASTVLAMILTGRVRTIHVVLLTSISSLVAIYWEKLTPLLKLRFASEQVDASDLQRTLQHSALWKLFMDAPLLGNGFGSYTFELIRSVLAPYSYENQILAMMAQIGIIGMAVLVVLLAAYFRQLLSLNRAGGSRRAGVLILLVAQLYGGFLNPSVVSSTAAIAYGFLYALAGFYIAEYGKSRIRPPIWPGDREQSCNGA